MTKILIYNWSRLEKSNPSGGVSIYTKNLISELIKNPNNHIFYLNSGYSYTFSKQTFIKRTPNIFGDKIESFEIFNSPVIAPAQQSIKNTELFINDQSLYLLIKNWLNTIGGVDIIHFQNIEGLSLSVLNLKKDYPNTKFIYSLHNYFPICPAVNLWAKVHNCHKSDFSECVRCFRRRNYTATKYLRAFSNSNITEAINYYFFRNFVRKNDCETYQLFFEKTREYFKNIDVILAVSNQVKDIFVRNGYDQNKIITSYIGTRIAENCLQHSNADIYSTPFRIIFMGYMNEAKGFNFFLNALANIPKDISKDFHITICAKYSTLSNKNELNHIKELKKHFHSIDLFNGYDSSNQKNYLQGQHLGIVPVLWEDNLPQVLIEQIAYGVPVLCSNLGGGKEIVNNPDFVFEAGNEQDFINKLLSIYSDRTKLSMFWGNVKKLTILEEHVNFLNTIYYSK